MKVNELFFILIGLLPAVLFSSERIITKNGETYIKLKDIDSKEVQKIIKTYRRFGEYENARKTEELEAQSPYEYIDLESMENKVQRIGATGTIRD